MEGIADDDDDFRAARCLMQLGVERFVRVLLEPRPLRAGRVARPIPVFLAERHLVRVSRIDHIERPGRIVVSSTVSSPRLEAAH